MASWNDVFSCTSRTRHELYLTSTTLSFCAKLATLEKFWHITKQVVIKRGEELIPRSPAVYLRCEYRSFQEPERGGFAVKTTAKCVDESLDIVHLQNAKPVVTPLTEPKSANSHDETTVCDQAARVVVGVKLWQKSWMQRWNGKMKIQPSKKTTSGGASFNTRPARGRASQS